VKSGKLYYIIAGLSFFLALLTGTVLAAPLLPLSGQIVLLLAEAAEVLEGIFLYAVWVLPVILLAVSIFSLTAAAHRYIRPAIFFILILSLTAVLFLHSFFDTGLALLENLISEKYTPRKAALILLIAFVLELSIFALWARYVFRKYRTSGGQRQRQKHPKTAPSRNSSKENISPNSPDTEASAVSPEEKKKIDRKVKRQLLKMQRKRLKKTSKAGKARELEDEHSEAVSAAADPAYRPAEGEHRLNPADGEQLDEIFHIPDDYAELPTTEKQSDRQGLSSEWARVGENLTLTFPFIPDLPELNQVGRKTRPIQQEMAFSEDSEIADPLSEPLADRKYELRDTHEGLTAAGEPSGELPAGQPDLNSVQRSITAAQQTAESETEQSQSSDVPSEATAEETFIPGIIGLSSNTAKEESGSVTDNDTVLFSNLRKGNYLPPSEDLLIDYPDISSTIDEHTKKSGEILMQTLREFKIEAALTGVQKGPVVTMFEIMPAPGIRVQTITNLADNIALQLAASRVRIVAPIPGKQAVGIEVPNRKRSIVGFKEMLFEIDRHSDYFVPMVLGTDITGEKQIIDLVKTPHLLIAGATGSGKSVCVNSLICSILYRRSPKEVRLMMVDPKIVELKLYNNIPHLLTPVITEPKKALKALQYCLLEMERRYSLLDNLNVRDLASYNKRITVNKLAREKLPYIVVIIDEFADLMTTTGKELEGYLARLAAMARAVGIHLVLATQRPSTNVITGIIKANIPSRIAFMVTSNTDSRIIIDQPGAEKLLGRGDMLFSSSWDPIPSRIQGAFLTEEEVEKIVAHVKTQGEPDYLDEDYFTDEEDEDDFDDYDDSSDEDDLMQEALVIVSQRGTASASYLQRRLKIGYNRAARLVEEMEERGIVGPSQGSKPREVLRMPGME
jgi:DNA segregation ATPase FtsK/SpoIIIE-like protein